MTDSELPFPSYKFVHDSYASQVKQSCALAFDNWWQQSCCAAKAEYKSIKARQLGGDIYVCQEISTGGSLWHLILISLIISSLFHLGTDGMMKISSALMTALLHSQIRTAPSTLDHLT